MASALTKSLETELAKAFPSDKSLVHKGVGWRDVGHLGRKKWKRDTLCVISGVYKRAYHQSVSSWCREKMKYHVRGAERRSYGWHLIWRFSAQQHKHNATHTGATRAGIHTRNLPPRAATQTFVRPNMRTEPCTEINCDLVFFIMWRVHVHSRRLGLGNKNRREDCRGGMAVKHWLTGNDLTDILIKEKSLGGPSISREWQG